MSKDKRREPQHIRQHLLIRPHSSMISQTRLVLITEGEVVVRAKLATVLPEHTATATSIQDGESQMLLVRLVRQVYRDDDFYHNRTPSSRFPWLHKARPILRSAIQLNSFAIWHGTSFGPNNSLPSSHSTKATAPGAWARLAAVANNLRPKP